LVFFFEFVG